MTVAHAMPRLCCAPCFMPLLIALFLGGGNLRAQCEEFFSQAENRYQSGDIAGFLEMLRSGACMKNLPSENRIRLYELAGKAYIFLGSPKDADSVFVKILQLKPYYTPPKNEAELVYLAGHFRSLPILRVGGFVGTGLARAQVLQEYSLGNPALSEKNYARIASSTQVGLRAQVPVDKKALFSLQIGTNLTIINMRYQEKLYTANLPSQGPNLHSRLTFAERQLWLQVPLGLHYAIGLPNRDSTARKDAWKIYGGVGIAPSLLLSGTFNNLRRQTTDASGITVSQEVLSTNGQRNRFNLFAQVQLGASWEIGKTQLFVELQYQRQLSNVANPENRYADADFTYLYAYASDDFLLHFIGLNVGIHQNFYIQKRKSND